MFYTLTYTIDTVRHTEDCLTLALLADRLKELSEQHAYGDPKFSAGFVVIESVTPLAACLDVIA